jgi:hypothetical protein
MVCDSSKIAELLAIQGDLARPPLLKAYRRASRRAFLWPEGASDLAGIGPYLARIIRGWIEDPPATSMPPDIRKGF